MPTSKTRHSENKRNLQLDAHRCAAVLHSLHSTQVMMASDQIKLSVTLREQKNEKIHLSKHQSTFLRLDSKHVITTVKMRPENTQPFFRL